MNAQLPANLLARLLALLVTKFAKKLKYYSELLAPCKSRELFFCKREVEISANS